MNRRSLLCSFAAIPIVAVPGDLVMRSPITRERRPGIDYAKAGETPGWEDQHVIDLDTGRKLELDCEEVDCVDGWALCWRGPAPDREKVIVRGRFRLEPIGE